MQFKNAFYLPSGRVFLLDCDGFPVECTEMRDVTVGGKDHEEVRTSNDPHVIWNHLKPYNEKWLLTVSTQKGCPHKCKFCDVAGLGFSGNLTVEQILEQVSFILDASPYVQNCSKVKIGFARMGEPSHNLTNVLNAMKMLPSISSSKSRVFTWLPCFNSILPKKTIDGRSAYDVIERVLAMKDWYNGFLHFQISANSTDENIRKQLFGGADVLGLEEIVKYINGKSITNRTITLNFIVIDGVPIDVKYLKSIGVNGSKFNIKLIPLNNTERGIINNLKTYANYTNYDKLIDLGDEIRKEGIPVVVDAIAKCEEAGLCCGQLAHIYAKNN
jgi:23S rRNA (adenine2503-C2)-methyltransferase